MQAPAAVLPQIRLKKMISLETKEKIESKYGVTVICPQSGATHPHPYLATERELCIDGVLRRCAGFHSHGDDCVIFDVFGNPGAFQRRGQQVHSCIPYHHASDVERRAMAPPDWFCECEPDVCGCGPFDVAIFVQSVQYLAPERLAEVIIRMQDRVAYSVLHRFNGIAGSFYGKEQTWYRSSATTVVCSTDDGVVKWEHDSLDWLDKPYYIPKLNAVLISHQITAIGETHMYSHTLQDANAFPRPVRIKRDWNLAAVRSDGEELYALPSAFVGDAKVSAVLTSYRMRSTHIRVWSGLVVMCGGEDEDVVLSAAVVSIMTTYFLAKKHDAATYRAAITVCKGHYLAIPNMPADRLPRAVIATVLLAFVASASLEISLLTGVLWETSGLIDTHSALVDFQQPMSVSTTTLAMGAASTAISLGVNYEWPTHFVTATSNVSTLVTGVHLHATSALVIGLTSSTSVVVPPVAVAWTVASTILSCYWYYRSHIGSGLPTQIVQSWESVVPGDLPRLSGVPVQHFAYAPRYSATRHMKPRNLKLKEATTLKVTSDPKEGVESKAISSHQGIAFTLVQPTYYECDQASFISAVTNRVLMETPKPVAGVWKMVSAAYNETRFQKEYFKNKAPFDSSLRALNDWTVRYPLARREDFERAHEQLKAQNFTLTAQDRVMGAFTKTEKQVAVSLKDGEVLSQAHDLKAPRLIHSMSDIVLALEGPIAHQIGQRQKLAYESMEKWIGLAPRECSAETLGDWLDEAVEFLGGADAIITLDDDGKIWDAHTVEDAIHAQNAMLLGDLPFKNQAVRKHFLRPQRKVAKSRRGVRYTMPVQRVTGESFTDKGNTKINEAKTCYCLERGNSQDDPTQFLGLGVKYCIANCGDDSYIVVNRAWLHEKFATLDETELKEIWNKSGLRLGYTLTLNVGKYLEDREFCSRWFYPVAGRHIPGSKIGRVLARAGWFLDCKDEQTIMSAALSSLTDNYHVPFLKEYFERVVQLAPRKLGGRPQDWSWHCGARHVYDDSTMDFVSRKYGLVKQDLEEFKKLLASVKSLPVVLDWQPLARLLEIDA